ENGGETFGYVPALNASKLQIDLMLNVIERHTTGWHALTENSELSARRERALAAGASR
ncbi:MAG: ferrochelatase, partial [Xanthomonadaceae bacterium]|nr:ferrochelatase [Xanthomonadaceae bacterium]